jgi:hypothetical protein
MASSNLETSLAKLLHSGAHSDITFVLVDDDQKEIRAHKLILMARSEVFEEMFEEKPITENVVNHPYPHVAIAETRLEVFQQVLKFIYTGKVDQMDGFTHELLNWAHKV